MDINQRAEKWRSELPSHFRTQRMTPEDERFFQEGIEIISVLAQARGFVASFRRYSTSHRISLLKGFMVQVKGIRSAAPQPSVSIRFPEGERKTPEERKPKEKRQGKESREAAPEVQKEKKEECFHLDSYIDILPQELKSQAMTIRDEYLVRAEYHRQAQRMVEEGASKEKLSEIAMLICHEDDKIRNFWDQVHEFLRQRGSGQLDDEAMEKLRQEGERLRASEKRGDGEWTADEILALEKAATTDEERERAAYLRRQRIENRKKYIRKPIQDSADHDVKVRMAVEELRKLGITRLSEKIRQVALASGMKEDELW